MYLGGRAERCLGLAAAPTPFARPLIQEVHPMEAVASSVPTPETDLEPLAEEATLLDVRGLSCPLPIVRISQAFAGLSAGATLEVLVTDRGALSDIPAWAKTTGNTLLEQDERGGAFRFVLRKGGPR